MPSILNAQANGQAPSGATVGDIVNTAGGTYQVMPAGSPGASYNESSGLWSKKLADDPYTALTAYQLGQTQANTAKSEAMANRQMDFQIEQNAKAMEFSSEEAEKNRQWQERMSNTAHVREVRDLINAGLNPILSANTSGASTPSGSAAAGVTSSGSQGSVDTSGASVMSNLISAMLSKYVADSTNYNQFAMNLNSTYTQRQVARLQTDAQMFSALTSAEAVKSAAATSAAASMFAANKAYEASRYSAASTANWQTKNKQLDYALGLEQLANQAFMNVNSTDAQRYTGTMIGLTGLVGGLAGLLTKGVI